jgi:hypothetical protein
MDGLTLALGLGLLLALSRVLAATVLFDFGGLGHFALELGSIVHAAREVTAVGHLTDLLCC